MAVLERETQSLDADKEEAKRIVEEQYKTRGIPLNPTATIGRAQGLAGECLRVHGVRPEDYTSSRAIITAREE